MIANEQKPNFDVVIVTPTYLSSNPRVVKEADALANAGLRVCVVFSQGQLEWARSADDAVTTGRDWSARAVRWSPTAARDERARYWWSSIRFRGSRRLAVSEHQPLWLALRAECRTYPELAAQASGTSARLYIGHYPEGLAAAASAADRVGAGYAYDVEDFHTEEETPTSKEGVARKRRIETIERAYVGGCAYVSAVSQGVADAFQARYGGAAPRVVHNVFCWKERESLDRLVKDRRGPETSLYWYSQVVGLDRGLQEVIRALGCVGAPFQLHVRGRCSESVAQELRTLAQHVGVAGRLHFHEPVLPSELLSRTAEHDIGLALEQPVSQNRLLTVTNKLFFYLLAGLAVVATDTPGQAAVVNATPGVGDMYPPGNHEALAVVLRRLMTDQALLSGRRQAAIAAARDRWNWEREQSVVTAAVDEALRGAATGLAPVNEMANA